jgi:integrase
VKEKLITANVAVDLDGKPRRSREKSDEARLHAWTAEEAARFLDAAKNAGAQPAALYALALDTGMRKGELGGLRWENVDLAAGTVRVVEQIVTLGEKPEFGPLKAGKPRTISLAAETVELLRTHKRMQAEVKLKNRTRYADHGLVFAKEWNDMRKRTDTLGYPLQLNNLGQREYAALIKAANVRRIKFHGLRHTCATLLLQAGEPVHTVSRRLGHSKVTMTLEVYAHVLPDMQKSAATTIGRVLYGR